MIYQPLEHQRMGIDHLGSHPIGALFAGMGLGKTAMVLERLSRDIADGASKGALVIAPLRVSLFTWRDEAAKWDNFKWMRVVSLRTKEGKEAWEKGEACIYTINYESLFIPRTNLDTGEVVDHGLLAKLIKGRKASELPVDTVVWDELSKAKDPKSKRVREFRKYRSKFKRHWGLTGTPVSENHLELFAQVRLLDDGELFGRHMGNFKQQYFEPVDFHQRVWRVRDGCAGMIEDKLKKIALTLRSEDWLDVPPTDFIDVEVKLAGKAQTLYKKLQKEMIVQLTDSKVKAVNKGVLLLKLQQVASGAVYAEDTQHILSADDTTKVVTHIHDFKIGALKKLWWSEGREPMIVVIRFKHERERLLKEFASLGAKAFHSDLLPAWNRGEIPMLIAHPLSMSHGLNMQSGGSRICWFTLPFSLDEYNQLNARLVRTGQKSRTKIFRLLASGTVDDATVATLEAKKDNQDSFFARMVENICTLDAVE